MTEHFIIMADDDQDDYDLITSVFKELDLNCNFSHAKNGAELIDMLEKNMSKLPDMILLDVNMPKMDGVEALGIIRSKPGLLDIPIIICSTSGSEELIEKCGQLGADAFVTKECSMKKMQVFAADVYAFLNRKGELPGKISSFKKIKSKKNILH